MRIISRKPLTDFSSKHPQAREPLDAWFHEVKNARWETPADVKASYNSADVIANNRIIFNIGGNKYRLIVAIAYQVGVVYIKFVGTHKEYDKVDAATIDLK